MARPKIHGIIRSCAYCGKYYHTGKFDRNTNVFSGGMVTNEFDSGGHTVCFHCVFTMNYAVELRANFDGAFGKNIIEYILECKDTHDVEHCNNKSDIFSGIGSMMITCELCLCA